MIEITGASGRREILSDLRGGLYMRLEGLAFMSSIQPWQENFPQVTNTSGSCIVLIAHINSATPDLLTLGSSMKPRRISKLVFRSFAISFGLICWNSSAIAQKASSCELGFSLKNQKVVEQKQLKYIRTAQRRLDMRFRLLAIEKLQRMIGDRSRISVDGPVVRSVEAAVMNGLDPAKSVREWNWSVLLAYGFLTARERLQNPQILESNFWDGIKFQAENMLRDEVDIDLKHRYPLARHIDLFSPTLFPGIASFEQTVELIAHGRSPLGYIVKARTVDGIPGVVGSNYFSHDVGHFQSLVQNMEIVARVQRANLSDVLYRSIRLFKEFQRVLRTDPELERPALRTDIFFLLHLLTFEKQIVILSYDRFQYHANKTLRWDYVQASQEVIGYRVTEERFILAIAKLKAALRQADANLLVREQARNSGEESN